ncbi:MAG TPA: hypothetical protein VGY56_08170 [Verrucomicrobiae bacterium]|nr:hypothetical protein [Verrucomicrobiae bacterium]
MRHPILGFCCTLAFLFFGYAGAWFGNPNEIQFLARNPGAASLAFETLTLAFFFAVGVSIFVVWPQAWLASWLARRFRFHRFFPFAFFFGVCSIAVCVLDFAAVDHHRLIVYLIGTGYLFISCLIFWSISYRNSRGVNPKYLPGSL